MPDVIFDEEQQAGPRPVSVSQKPSGFVKLIYVLGLAKTKQGAEYVLIGVILLCIALSFVSLVVGRVL